MENNITLPVSSFITLHNGKKLKIIEKRSCDGCYFLRKKCQTKIPRLYYKNRYYSILGHCSSNSRLDGKSIIYMLVEKTKTSKNQ